MFAVPVEVRDCLGVVGSELGEGIPVDGLGISDQGLPPGGWVARRQRHLINRQLASDYIDGDLDVPTRKARSSGKVEAV